MKILAIGAHLDDIELACGGTLAKAIKCGHTIKAVIMSKSGYINNAGNIQRPNDIAVVEGTNALNILGVTDIEIFDFPTKDIPYNSETIHVIDLVLESFQPDLVLSHHPFDTHQAHEAVSKTTIAACRRHNNILFFEPIAPSGRSYVAFKPQVNVDISEEIDIKIQALKAHKSEYIKFGGENWVDGAKSRCRFRGYEMGVQYAESFEMLRGTLFLSDKNNFD